MTPYTNPLVATWAAPGAAAVERWRFGPFELDASTGELWRDGRLLRLQPQPSRVLLVLVRQAGRLVTREQLRRELWGDDVHVNFDQGLAFCVCHLRTVLQDDARRPHYVETLPRRGFRFVGAPVRLDTGSLPAPAAVVPPLGPAPAADTTPVSAPVAPLRAGPAPAGSLARRLRRWALALGVVGLAALTAAPAAPHDVAASRGARVSTAPASVRPAGRSASFGNTPRPQRRVGAAGPQFGAGGSAAVQPERSSR